MTSQYRHRRTSDPTKAFPFPIEPGEIAVNTANRQLAVGDANSGSLGAPIPLLALRYFDARAQYAAGELVVQSNIIYRALGAVVPGAFNSSQWEAIAGVALPAYVLKAGDTMSGPLTLNADPSTALGAATKQYTDTKAPQASPTFTGTVTVPTPAVDDSSTKAASTAYVLGQAASTLPIMNGTAAIGTSTKWAHADHVHPSDTSKLSDAPADSKQYARQNNAWTVVAATGGASVTISDTAPASPTAGNLWWNSTSGHLFIYYNDGDSSQWVIAEPLPDMSAYVQIFVQDTKPTAANAGALWWNSVTGTLYIYYNDGDSTQWVAIASSGTQQATQVVRSYLAGLTLSTAGSSATFSVAAGVAADNGNVDMMTLAASISKTTGAWAAGSGTGALDTGAISASAWYHVFLIKNPGTAAVDILISLSPTAPTLPSGYTLFRRIGSMVTSASNWLAFKQLGDEFFWMTPQIDQNGVTCVVAATLRQLSVPSGIQVTAFISSSLTGVGSSVAITYWTPDVNSMAGGLSAWAAAGQASASHMYVRTNTSGQIYNASSSTSGTFTVNTFGWIDRRGRDL
jgi:hypothetical protein